MRIGSVLLLVSIAACAPSTFDNLTGGTKGGGVGARDTRGDVKEDPTLAAARPTSPPSGSWVNTARPVFRWALPTGATGARIELSKTRDFAQPQVLSATGDTYTLQPQEQLEPGTWFWRLKTTTPSSFASTKPTDPIWQLVVRGPGQKKESAVPYGHLTDLNGDGVPDISFTAEVGREFFPDMIGEPPPGPLAVVWSLLADKAGLFSIFNQQSRLFAQIGSARSSLAGGDIDGDGYSDLVIGQQWQAPELPGGFAGEITVFHGGKDGTNLDKDNEQGWVSVPFFAALPNLEVAGDVNGDGYADLAVGLPESNYVALGGERGLSAASLMMVPKDGRPTPAGATLATAWADLDGDGLSDLAIASSIPNSPVAYLHGARERLAPFAPLNTAPDIRASSRARAITSGDFDGDGKLEFAFSTVVDGIAAVCFHAIDSTLTSASCKPFPSAPVDGFGVGLAAVDIDADGADDLVVASATSLAVVKVKEPGNYEVLTVPAPPGGTTSGGAPPKILATAVLHPGRPTKGRWAIVTDDRSVTVFTGTEASQTFAISDEPHVLAVGPVLR